MKPGNIQIFVFLISSIFCLPISNAFCGVAELYSGGVRIDSLPSDNFININGGLDNFYFRVLNEKKATVAFVGGSITAGKGWREKVTQYLESRFPDVSWTFINAGIPSLGSVPHAFRLESDVLSQGKIDLLFIESAVNDLANGTPLHYQRRALEGLVRHALHKLPSVNIVLMAFADEIKNAEYASGTTPKEVKVHEHVAKRYDLPFINLAREIYERIDAGEFTWKEDFIDLHPSPFGHNLYFRSIRRMFELCAARTRPPAVKPRRVKSPSDAHNYSGGRYVAVERADDLRGFSIDPSWRPKDEAKARNRFVDLPVLVSEKPGSSFRFSFNGDAVGIAILSGPDAGTIVYSIDGGPEQTQELYTQWSRSLHLPWYIMLADGLRAGDHEVSIRLAESRHPKATGTACRIVYFLVNNPVNASK